MPYKALVVAAQRNDRAFIVSFTVRGIVGRPRLIAHRAGQTVAVLWMSNREAIRDYTLALDPLEKSYYFRDVLRASEHVRDGRFSEAYDIISNKRKTRALPLAAFMAYVTTLSIKRDGLCASRVQQFFGWLAEVQS